MPFLIRGCSGPAACQVLRPSGRISCHARAWSPSIPISSSACKSSPQFPSLPPADVQGHGANPYLCDARLQYNVSLVEAHKMPQALPAGHGVTVAVNQHAQRAARIVVESSRNVKESCSMGIWDPRRLNFQPAGVIRVSSPPSDSDWSANLYLNL